MKTLRVQIHFHHFRYAELEVLCAVIIQRMMGNEFFLELAPDVAIVQAAHVSYAKALSDAAGGGAQAKLIKDECRLAVEEALHDMGVKINLKAKGNERMLEPTGYPIVGGSKAGKQAKTGPLDKPGAIEFTLYRGTGNIGVSIEPVDGASSYLWQFTQVPVTAERQWISVNTTDFECIIPGFTIGTEYAFRVAGVGKSQTQVFSEVMTSYAI